MTRAHNIRAPGGGEIRFRPSPHDPATVQVHALDLVQQNAAFARLIVGMGSDTWVSVPRALDAMAPAQVERLLERWGLDLGVATRLGAAAELRSLVSLYEHTSKASIDPAIARVRAQLLAETGAAGTKPLRFGWGDIYRTERSALVHFARGFFLVVTGSPQQASSNRWSLRDERGDELMKGEALRVTHQTVELRRGAEGTRYDLKHGTITHWGRRQGAALDLQISATGDGVGRVDFLASPDGPAAHLGGGRFRLGDGSVLALPLPPDVLAQVPLAEVRSKAVHR